MKRLPTPISSALGPRQVRWRERLRAHVSRWAERFRRLDAQSEGLEVALAISTGFMAAYFARCPPHGTGSMMADQMFSIAPRLMWVWLLGSVSVLGVLSWLEDSTPGRRTSAFLSFSFWFGTGAWLAPRYPNLYTPWMHMLIGFFASWVWTRIGELSIKCRYRKRSPIAATVAGGDDGGGRG